MTRVTPKDMDVLMCLIDAKGRVVSRESILESVWSDVVVNPEAVSLSISRLRTALGESARSPQHIETVPTRGYRWVEQSKHVSFDGKKVVIVGLSFALVIVFALFLIARTAYESAA